MPRSQSKSSAALAHEIYVASVQAGNFSEAANAIDEAIAADHRAVSVETLLLRARLHVRRDPAASIALLSENGARFVTARQRAELSLREGAAFARLGDFHSAIAKFDRAKKLAGHDPTFAREIALQRAGGAWIARRLEEAEELALVASEEPAGDVFFEARIVLAMIAASRGRLSEQGAILLEARNALARDPSAGLLPRAVIGSQIAFLARELPSTALRDAAYADVNAIPWTRDVADLHFTMLRAVAWRYALEGDEFSAFRHLKAAAEAAPTSPWHVMSSCDRAYFAEVLGELRWSEQELSDAHILANRIEWGSLVGEERFALSLLAERFAARDPAMALAYVARYKQTGKQFAATFASNDDKRVDAMESFSFGIVQLALGETEESIRLLTHAYDIYDEIGYDWRAARAAVELARATKDQIWLGRAREKLVAYPNSWLARKPKEHAHSEPPEAARLTPAQRAVYDSLLLGRSSAEIALEQGRSEFTVLNHIKKILKAFGVRSRTALLARANVGARTPRNRLQDKLQL